ncbi:MAG TPA: hypothetical protein VM487_05250 [Phycisphaerae bacterium]|nr:hypothetical protein [Phycisphaerae bacterium]
MSSDTGNERQETSASSRAEMASLHYARGVDSRRRGWWVAIVTVGIVALLLIGLLAILSALDRRGGHDPRNYCSADLRALGMSLHMYHNDHGVFPPNLLALVTEGLTTWHELDCACRRDSHAGPFDFHYVTGLREGDPAGWIIAFDDPGNHRDGSGSILYLDCTVHMCQPAEFAQELQRFQIAFEKDRGRPPTILGRDQPFLVPWKHVREQQESAYREWLDQPSGP